MVPGILAKKIGMTQVFDQEGVRVPVTVLEAGPCQIYGLKTQEKDGYNAVQLAFEDVSEKRLNKPQKEYVKAKKLKPKRFVREILCAQIPDVKIGDEMKADIFQEGDFLDVTGTSKGKGFQGGVRRWGWYGGADTHGSMSHRAPGSVGSSSYPSKVLKGLKMAGHMGHTKITVQNLKVVDVDPEKNIITVKGAIPGPNGTYLVVKFAKKKPIADRKKAEQTDPPEGQEKSEG